MEYIYILKDPDTMNVVYVGKTKNKKKRYYEHRSRAANNKQTNKKAKWVYELLLKNKIPIFEIIEECEFDGDIAEMKWIKYYRDCGVCILNQTDGGNGILGCVRDEQTRIKISKNHARWSSKKTYQFNEDGSFVAEYKSTVIAAKKTGVEQNSISRCCRRGYRQAGGFYWSYNKKENMPPPYLNHNAKSVVKIHPTSLKILSEYSSITMAAKENHIARQNIKIVCQNKTKTAGGYIWKYKQTA